MRFNAKSITIILISVILLSAIFFSVIFFSSLKNRFLYSSSDCLSTSSTERKTNSTSEKTMETTSLAQKIPTRTTLIMNLNNEFEDLGSCQIITVFYEDKNQAILENDAGIRITSAISIDSESTLSFTLTDVTPYITNLKIGQSVYLIESNGKLYAYKQD